MSRQVGHITHPWRTRRAAQGCAIVIVNVGLGILVAPAILHNVLTGPDDGATNGAAKAYVGRCRLSRQTSGAAAEVQMHDQLHRNS